MMTTTFRQRQIIRSRTLYRKFHLTQHDKFCSHEVEATKSFYMGTQCVQPSYAMVGHGENEKLAMLRSVSLSVPFIIWARAPNHIRHLFYRDSGQKATLGPNKIAARMSYVGRGGYLH